METRWKQDFGSSGLCLLFSSKKSTATELKGVLSPCHMLSRVKEAAEKVNTLGKGPLFFFQVASIIRIHAITSEKSFSDKMALHNSFQ